MKREPMAPEPTAAEEQAPREAIVSALEEDIVLGRLHPRERLVEDTLMARFGAKRHTVRDVLTLLERMGLVERTRNVGAQVRSFTEREVHELYALRVLLEAEAARRILLPVDPAALEALSGVQRAHDAAVAANDACQVFRTNQRFHELLFGLTGDDTLRQAIAEYARRTHPIRFLSLVSAPHRLRAQKEHKQMLSALRRGDREALVRLCSEHLQPSRDAYLAAHGARIAPPAGNP
jgi:DNA-binding GntR family transcriptional regulator